MEENQWLETSTKEKALKKLNAIKETIDYEEWIMNNTELDSYYNLVKIWEGGGRGRERERELILKLIIINRNKNLMSKIISKISSI